jgi:hypothetical protein
MAVSVVEIDDINDEFNFGHKSPQSIKDFLAYAKTVWKRQPRFAMLVGDASLDPKNYLGAGDFDFISTKLIDTIFVEAASDDWLADLNNDGLPELAIGRLPVRTAQQAAALAAKISIYESSSPLQEMLHVTDSNEGFNFEAAHEQLRELVPSSLRLNEIKRGRVDHETARRELIESVNRGQKIVNYAGHGSVDLWRGNLLTIEDVKSFENKQRLSIFVMMTCLNGYFHDPVQDSLAETLIKADGGAVAVWASSGLTLPDGQAAMNQGIYRLIFAGGSSLTLGEAAKNAKAVIGDIDVRRTWILFGDPSMKLR